MQESDIELQLYYNCLDEIKRRINVIADHLNKVTTEKYLIIEVETMCLQFRKILEKIMLMSLVANKEQYAAQNEKFAKHYHAERIMRDLEKVNPNFYPTPIKKVQGEGKISELVSIENGYLTKEELIEIYEKCGGMMHICKRKALEGNTVTFCRVADKNLLAFMASSDRPRGWKDNGCCLDGAKG